MINYVEAIGACFPNVGVVCIGDPTNYANLTWETGDPIPTQAAIEAAFLEVAKKKRIVELSHDCEQAIISGFVSSALGTPHMYDSEVVDQLNLAGSLVNVFPTVENPNGGAEDYAARPVVDGVVQPKVYINHTFSQLKQVVADGVAFKLNLLKQFNTKRDYILNQVTDFEELPLVLFND